MVLRTGAGDDADQRVVMAREDLRRAVQHEVGAVLDGTQQDRAEHGVVHDDSRAGLVRLRDRCIEVRKAHQRVGARLEPHEVRGRRWPRLIEGDDLDAPATQLAAKQPHGSPIAAVSNRDLRARAEQREDERGRRPGAGGEQERMPALELAEQSLGLKADGVRQPLVVDRTRRRVDVGVNRRALERRQLAQRDPGLPLHPR